MPTSKKEDAIEEIADRLSRSTVAILTEYRGLSVSEITQLRRKLREQGIDYGVTKNTLARIAATRSGRPELIKALEGPVAIAFGYGDVSTPAKVLSDYVRTTRTVLKITGGLLERQVLTASEVTELANMPSREVMASQLLGVMQAPVSGLLGVLNAHIGGLMNIFQARIEQLEEGGAATA